MRSASCSVVSDPPQESAATGGRSPVEARGGSTLLAQARATNLAGTKTLTVPFPTAATSLTPNLPGLSVGAVQVQVLVQTASATFSLIGSVGLTVIDTRPVPGVSSINPNSIDLVAPPATFTIMGEGFVNLGFGLPVVNFTRSGAILAQARATNLAGTTTLTVPFPTASGLSAGAVQVEVYQQTASATFNLIGTVVLAVNDTRLVPGVSSINPNSIDLIAPPVSFTITGEGFVNLGFGLPVVNFYRGSTLLAQARATALTGTTTLTVPFPTASGLSAGVGTTTLTVPFPTAATSLTPGVPGPSAGPVQVQVWQQTSAGTYSLIGTVTLTVN